ncbi:hypothetical protein [Spirillospora sp. CA-294931]|uniref:hypothetical protein n=1 Tax=Spirillospora sp. CA-294931 TaxID=3240042 RepID=UPI003D8EB907
MTTAEICVQAGAKLLDRNRPGWEREIDLHEMDVSDPWRCPLAQLFGSYTEGLDRLDVNDSMVFGFESGRADYSDLTFAWRELITERRTSA